MHQCPQLHIQSDALQTILECNTIDTNEDEIVWLRINSQSYNLSVTPRTMTDKENDIYLTKTGNSSTVYRFKMGDMQFNIVFPSIYHILSVDKLPNLTCVCASLNKLMIGTDSGMIIKTENPPPINIKDAIVQEKAHYADITKILSFPSGVVLMTVGLDMQIKIWKNDHFYEQFGNPSRVLNGTHNARITDCLMIGRGRNIVSCGLDGRIVIWELGSGESVWVGRRIRGLDDGCKTLSISTNTQPGLESSTKFFECEDKILWCGHKSGTISVWDCSTRLSLGEFLSNKDGWEVEKISNIDMNTVVVGLNNGDLYCFKYNIKLKKAEEIWHTNVEKIEKDAESVSIKQMEVYKNYVMVLTDNFLMKIDAENGKLVDIYVGYDDTINGFFIDEPYNNNMIVVGKRSFLASFKI